MARRRNSILDAIEAFNSTYDTTTKIGRDIELSRAADAKVTEQAPVVDLIATPSEDGGPAVTTETQVAPKQFSLLGKTYDQAPTDSQQTMARNLAMAGIMKKYDPARGMQMEQAATTAQREEQRFGREQKNWELQDEETAKKKEYDEGRKSVFSSSRFGQNQQSYAKAMGDYQKRLEEYEAAKASGKSGPDLGLAPIAPTRPEYTPGDALADRAALIDHDFKYGKVDTKAFGEFTDMLNKVQSEGYEKTLKLAQAGSPIQEVAKAFNATGKAQFDPANVVSDKMVKNKDGVETRVIQYKDEQGNTRTINTVAELDALGKAGEVFNRFYQSEQNRRGNEQLQLSKNADGRAGAAVTREQTEKTDKANAAVALFQQRNPNATAAELEAVRKGVIDINPDNKNAPSEVKLAQAMVNAGLAPDMRSGLEMALTKKTQDPGELHKEFVAAGIKNMSKPEDAVASADKVMETMGYTKGNGRWTQPKAQSPAGGMASDPKAIAIRDDKNLTLEQKRAKLKELGYQ